MGAYTLEDEEVIGKGLSSSLRPLNYHMAVRIAVFCVNIPVFSGGHSPQAPDLPPAFAAAQPGMGPELVWGAGPEGPSPPSHPKPRHLPRCHPHLCWPGPHTPQGPRRPQLLRLLRPVLPCQDPEPAPGPSEAGWELGSWSRTSCSHLHQLK